MAGYCHVAIQWDCSRLYTLMGDVLLSLVGERLLSVLPGWLRRRLYPDARLAQDVTLKLRGEKPIQVNVSSKPSEVWAYFEVENHSPIDIVLDRITLFLWIEGGLADGVMANRHPVARHSTSDLIAWRSIITTEAADMVRRLMTQQGARLTADVTAYFTSPFGWFAVRPTRHFQRDVKDCV
jgi:hypothetical protein